MGPGIYPLNRVERQPCIQTYVAPLSSRLFMILREMPAYLSTAYSLRYKNTSLETNFISRGFVKGVRYIQLIKELVRALFNPSRKAFERNIKKMDEEFASLNQKLADSTRPICAYFVSAKDYNGAILGDTTYYYHHYKIQRFQEHFDVSARVVRSTKEMFEHLNELKAKYPERLIRIVDIVAHGSPHSIEIPSEHEANYYSHRINEDEFNACAPDADIIIDACSTGVGGGKNIAAKIASQNKGKKVFAPGASLFFSKPVFKVHQGVAKVDHVTHGFAIVNAYTSKKFEYQA